MTEAYQAPDVAAMIISHLNPLVGPPVASRIPNPRPADERMVRVTQVPSPGFEGLALFHGRAVVEAWGASEPAAYALAAECEYHIRRATGWHTESTGPGIYPPDPQTAKPKYGFTVDIYASGVTP